MVFILRLPDQNTYTNGKVFEEGARAGKESDAKEEEGHPQIGKR